MPFGFNFNLFNNNETNTRTPTTRRNVITIEEGLKTLQDGIVKLFNILEGSEPNFTPQEHIMLYTTVYNLCTACPSYDRELYNLYKQTCEEYIKSKVLPTMQEKKDEPLLRVLLERWSNYKIMTKRLTSIFSSVDQFLLRFRILPNLEKTSFLSFYHLVCKEINQEITDDIFAMIDGKLAVEKVEHTLDFLLRFDECTRKNRTKEEKIDYSQDVLSKKVNLISSDGDVFEVDYGVALMSTRFEAIIKTIPDGDDVGDILVDEVSSNILSMVIEYCKTHKHNNGLKDFDEVKDLDAEFANVDLKTLLDLTIAACYLDIHSLVKLTWSKVDNLLKGKTKTPEEISQIFGAADRRLKLRAIRREQRVESGAEGYIYSYIFDTLNTLQF